MEDTDLMPFGKFKGDQMQNVPASYLLWLERENKCFGKVKSYIDENMECLLKEDQDE